MAKVTKSSNPKPDIKKQQTMSPFSRDFMNGEQAYATPELLKKLATEWENEVWSNENINDPYSYLMSLGIRPRQARRWCETYDFFKEAYETVKEILFMRQYNRIKEVDCTKAEFMFVDYNSEYKEVYNWKANLKAKAQSSQEMYVPVQSSVKVKHD
ncbi:hypothetical protein UFOVP97_10 [uncultured Caudovirales phage]|uniref:Uncharacterized protein n=1 Tax=uncultured Caudovirales phage TaxID=2100421 RepID=A0A6J5L399_9CAUD|nr:hypothetical protein UFOVP97_10 [uncultured Caudovirales phage]CAB4134196.1 hypothetical protein UFOVP268_28 [uncultured Caudovirales phage]